MRVRTPFIVALAWVPFAVLWSVLVALYADATTAGAVASGIRYIGVAAMLGIGVWWLTGRVTWPEVLRPGFYVLHLGAASLYSALWVLGAFALAAAGSERELVRMLRGSSDLGWLFVMGLWLYGLVAGVSYALRVRDRLRRQERIAAEARALALEARLAGLRARLEPHFLYNALHTVGSLAGSDPVRAREAVDRLGDLLRYALDEDGDEVPLDREWRFSLDYLALERMRLEDRLAVESSIDDEARASLVPPFSLQVLVENAIRHAIAPSPRGGGISIAGRHAGGRLILEVRDDGPGARAEEVAAGKGHGLGVLRERLAARYGSEADLEIETAPGAGFLARVTIPRVDAGDEPSPADGVCREAAG